MKKDNKNKQLMTDTELNKLATKIVSRMMKLKTMEDWFTHVVALNTLPIWITTI